MKKMVFDEKDTITKDGRQLSTKQMNILQYNDFDLSKVSQMLYKDVSQYIGGYITRHKEYLAMMEDYEDYNDWECPINN